MTKKQKILTTILVIVGIVAVIFFGMRATRAFMRMRGAGLFGKPPAANQTDVSLIRDWMTVPYIAHMYNVPPDALFKSLNLPVGYKNSKKSLKELNDEFYPDQTGVILAHMQAAIQAMQKQEPPPKFPATPIPPPSPTPTATP